MRALLSVAQRDGVASLGQGLQELGIELFATPGTLAHLAEHGVTARPVEELATGDAPLLGGRVRTFQARIYAAILARRDRRDQLEELAKQGIEPIDLVVVNLRPFAPEVGEREMPLEEAVELIDLGGAPLLAAAARNFAWVTPVCDPSDYPAVLAELREGGAVSEATRLRLAAQAFAAVAAYHAEVAAYIDSLGNVRYPQRLPLVLTKIADLRYGENPHQSAALYRETTHHSGAFADAEQLQGEPPSFNDLLDLDTAYDIVNDFVAATVAIVKQRTPVGLASDDNLAEAYRRALDGDPVSAFGAVLAVNRTLDAETAQAIVETPYEAIVAPAYAPAARAVLETKPGLSVLRVPARSGEGPSVYGIADLDLRRIAGGILVQQRDLLELDRSQLQVVTQRRPTLEELTDLLFAWRAVRHVPSNAVVLAHKTALVGVGAGQASRLTAVEIALHRAADRANMSVLASDAYFPFADAIQLAAERGVMAIIQPGGSRRDAMAVELADRHHMAMVFTGRRHFRH